MSGTSFDGSFAYTPDPGFTGLDTFTDAVLDGIGTSAPATVTVTITVAPPNRPAVAVDDALTTPHGTALVARTGADPGRSWPWGWPLC